MKVLVVLSALVACGLAAAGGLVYSGVAPLGYYGGLGLWGGAAPWSSVVPLATAGVRTQYHGQNELGLASYGHAEPLQAHHAVQDSFGNKVGSYSYLNPHDGRVHRTDYVADALGYRVAANDLPVAPPPAPVALPVAPEPVVDTPEVAAARTAHLAEHERAANRTRRSVLPLVGTLVAHPLVAHPVLIDATLTTVVNNPGHAVSYRVD